MPSWLKRKLNKVKKFKVSTLFRFKRDPIRQKARPVANVKPSKITFLGKIRPEQKSKIIKRKVKRVKKSEKEKWILRSAIDMNVSNKHGIPFVIEQAEKRIENASLEVRKEILLRIENIKKYEKDINSARQALEKKGYVTRVAFKTKSENPMFPHQNDANYFHIAAYKPDTLRGGFFELKLGSRPLITKKVRDLEHKL